MKYPNLEMCIWRNYKSIREFCCKARVGKETMYHVLDGTSEPRKATIDKILQETGMKYEECFEEGDGIPH